MDQAAPRIRLVVFADDWGRHPSSCQHLISRLTDRCDVLWVNTIGTRPPRFSLQDAGKAVGRFKQWLCPRAAEGSCDLPHAKVISPKMWPGFRRPWQQRFNARKIGRAVNRAIAAGPMQKSVAVTTLPIMADVVGRIDVDRWVYYCVDDFSVWPGLDGHVMQQMEKQLVQRVDAHVAASDTLMSHLTELGARPSLLTHGIDPAHWSAPPDKVLPDWWPRGSGPILLFWGLIDQRLNVDWCRAVAGVDFGAGPATVVLVGPRQSPDATIDALPNVVTPGPVDYDRLPSLAAAADVLVMPYRVLPVTRAMQPLKFKEYLATAKSVVATSLPATEPWQDAADLVDSTDDFVEAVRRRLAGPTDEQVRARERLTDESWSDKADKFLKLLLGEWSDAPPESFAIQSAGN